MNWDTFFLGVIAISSFLLVLAVLLVAVGLVRALQLLKATSVRVEGMLSKVEKEAVGALRQLQSTAKGMTDFSGTAKRLAEETALIFMARRMSKKAVAQPTTRGSPSRTDLLFAGLDITTRVLRLWRGATKTRSSNQ